MRPMAAAAGTLPAQAQAIPGTIYTCPMHPEIRQDDPGNCPKCGMTLEPLIPEDTADDDNPELRDFSRRFWWTLPLTVVVTVLAMAGHRLGWIDPVKQSWMELVLALPIVLWAGWPFFVRCVQSFRHRSPNMWTLIGIGIGTGAAFVYSVVATVAPQWFPASFMAHGRMGFVWPACAAARSGVAACSTLSRSCAIPLQPSPRLSGHPPVPASGYLTSATARSPSGSLR